MYHLPSYSRFFVQVTPDGFFQVTPEGFSKLLPIAVFAHQPTLISPARREDRQGIRRYHSGNPGESSGPFRDDSRTPSGRLQVPPTVFEDGPTRWAPTAHPEPSGSDKRGSRRENRESARGLAVRHSANDGVRAAIAVRRACLRVSQPFLRPYLVANGNAGGFKWGRGWLHLRPYMAPRFSKSLFHSAVSNSCSPKPSGVFHGTSRIAEKFPEYSA